MNARAIRRWWQGFRRDATRTKPLADVIRDEEAYREIVERQERTQKRIKAIEVEREIQRGNGQ